MRLDPVRDGTRPGDGTFPALMDSFMNALQWPAMIVTLMAAWLVASQSKRKNDPELQRS